MSAGKSRITPQGIETELLLKANLAFFHILTHKFILTPLLLASLDGIVHMTIHILTGKTG